MDPSPLVDIVAQQQTQSASDEAEELEAESSQPWSAWQDLGALGIGIAITGAVLGAIYAVKQLRKPVALPPLPPVPPVA